MTKEGLSSIKTLLASKFMSCRLRFCSHFARGATCYQNHSGEPSVVEMGNSGLACTLHDLAAFKRASSWKEGTGCRWNLWGRTCLEGQYEFNGRCRCSQAGMLSFADKTRDSPRLCSDA